MGASSIKIFLSCYYNLKCTNSNEEGGYQAHPWARKFDKKVRSGLREDTTGNWKVQKRKKVTIKRHQCYFFLIYSTFFNLLKLFKWVAHSRKCCTWGVKNSLSAAVPFLVNRVSVFGHLHLATCIKLLLFRHKTLKLYNLQNQILVT